MGNSYYDIECNDEELGIYTVRKRTSDTVYYLTLRNDGSWIHTCKAITVYGNNYLCRHKKLILGKYFANKDYKKLFNISPNKTNKTSGRKDKNKGNESNG